MDELLPVPEKRKILSGTRRLLAAIILVAMALGWLAHTHRQAERRTVLMSELAHSGVLARLTEPTHLSLIVKKFWPNREAWLRGKIGGGWFDHPSIFVTSNLGDEQLPGVIERLRELGTVQEVHYGSLSDEGISQLTAGLAGVNVVPNASPALHRFWLASMGEHVAYGAMAFALVVTATLFGLLAFSIFWVARRYRTAWASRALAENGAP
jgi:frataxin-like iron-binding protein CyaY